MTYERVGFTKPPQYHLRRCRLFPVARQPVKSRLFRSRHHKQTLFAILMEILKVVQNNIGPMHTVQSNP